MPAASRHRPPSLRSALLAWFDHGKRDLPWRRTKDAYAIWLSEVMLQQTQVVTVIPYWEKFLARFPTVESLARAQLEEVLPYWSGLGYYSRCRNLHSAAQAIVAEHGGRLPADAEALRGLPGFGPYTAGAVASIAFDLEAPIVDGNVARVFSRLFVVEGAPGDRAREKRLWALAAEQVKGPRPGDFNQALMELGATVCRVERPTCLLCPVRAHCGALASGRVDTLPPPRARPPRKLLNLVVAAWERDGALLMGQREKAGLFGGLWELPTAEYPARDADIGERLSESLGRKVTLGENLGVVRRTLTHRDLELHLFRVKGRAAPTGASGAYTAFRWVTPAQVTSLGLSTAMAKVLEQAWTSGRRPPAPVS
ncbi:MAG: A/G-specific adenine glycosylase [Pseudomonadota bacterium]|jgi:A/G-specific adenine glycosylase